MSRKRRRWPGGPFVNFVSSCDRLTTAISPTSSDILASRTPLNPTSFWPPRTVAVTSNGPLRLSPRPSR
ncbi:hypothetical protein AMJ39_03165 [candidate division TA06 bacterium DG_24]|uniref:Uncharacterized protein n=2 Tax=Bacteria division TA06 TaxID=1156500 RepID=A0A0S8JLI8_UNCT6|nr:MAG: hypothetical protein AMJ39_03165 [candidate division TA06 bacterium DG_24]KPL09499.1 MAG: hypothetical protein AMJ71_06195 [candidate division TA06 bacterium SM1_40]